VRNFVRVLGFPNTKTRYFDTPSKWGTEKMFSVVATRSPIFNTISAQDAGNEV
jgi:hypothetical protein